jgi:hypothetical protein
MKVDFYLALIGGILLLGIALGYCCHDREVPSAATFYIDPQLQQQFQERATQFASNALAEPITEWQVYVGQGEASTRLSGLVVADGMDSQGRQVFKVVFEKETGRPLRLVRFTGADKSLDIVSAKQPRAIAEWWLQRIGIASEGRWLRVRDGETVRNHFLSFWRSTSHKASIVINTRTRQLITVELETPPALSPPYQGTGQ